MAATSPAIAILSGIVCLVSGRYVGALFCLAALVVMLHERKRP